MKKCGYIFYHELYICFYEGYNDPMFMDLHHEQYPLISYKCNLSYNGGKPVAHRKDGTNPDDRVRSSKINVATYDNGLDAVEATT